MPSASGNVYKRSASSQALTSFRLYRFNDLACAVVVIIFFACSQQHILWRGRSHFIVHCNLHRNGVTWRSRVTAVASHKGTPTGNDHKIGAFAVRSHANHVIIRMKVAVKGHSAHLHRVRPIKMAFRMCV